jgi:hypothetical protein
MRESQDPSRNSRSTGRIRLAGTRHNRSAPLPGEGPPQRHAEELPVRQDQFAGLAGAGQTADQGDLAGAAAGQLPIQHQTGAHLDQTGHPHLGKGGFVLAAAVSGTAEGGLVGRAVGHVPAAPGPAGPRPGAASSPDRAPMRPGQGRARNTPPAGPAADVCDAPHDHTQPPHDPPTRADTPRSAAPTLRWP